ncbi:unnamed protein product [Paramecium octaurelia]|uniref:Tubulin/FtsZ GTPase domain-containing protein n=1 Tax=Paramecium octaurelia TaxID=43137 RepID=A0A8S1X6K8_PAROT|nr:unnamed protein product [Paramecium octaurelia]
MSSALHIHIGGAGVMIGDMLWKLYEAEHNETTQKNYIYEQVDGNHHPHAFFVDLDDRMIHEIQRNTQVQFKKNSFLSAKNVEDGLTYARGRYGPGLMIRDQALQSIRQQIEAMDRLDEFVITSSISGGTGSGFFSLLSERLYVDFGKVRQNGFIIFPSSEMSNNAIGIYNAVLSFNAMNYYFDSITMFDNQSMYNVIDHQLNLDFVDYKHLNNLVAQVISSYTGLKRFNSCDNLKFFQDVCPYPDIHYLIPSYGKLTLINDYKRKELDQGQFIKYITKKEQRLYQCPQNRRSLSTNLLLRQKELNNFYGKFNSTLKNLDHEFGQSTHIFQCTSSNYQVLPELAQMKQTGTFFSNDGSIYSRLKLLAQQYDKIFERRAFMFWYVGEGMEAKELDEGIEQVKQSMLNYKEVVWNRDFNSQDETYDDEY